MSHRSLIIALRVIIALGTLFIEIFHNSLFQNIVVRIHAFVTFWGINKHGLKLLYSVALGQAGKLSTTHVMQKMSVYLIWGLAASVV